MTPWRQSRNRHGGSVSLNEKPSAGKTKAQTRQCLRVLGIQPCLLLVNPNRLTRQVGEVKSVWQLMCVLHPYLHEFTFVAYVRQSETECVRKAAQAFWSGLPS